MTRVTRFSPDSNKARPALPEGMTDLATAPLTALGEDFRTARLRKGDDLAAVAGVLKIRKDHLTAIEDSKPEDLPGRTYAVGFVRSYAEYLGLDPQKCVLRYKDEIAGHVQETRYTPYIDETPDRRLPQGWLVAAILLILVIAYGAYYLVHNPGTEQPPPVAPVPARLMSHPAFKATHRAVAPAAQTAPHVTAPAAAPPASTLATQPAVQPSAPNAAPLPQGQVYGQHNAGSRVLLRAHEAVFVSVKGRNGAIYINRELQPGDTYHVPNLVGLTMSTSNAGVIELGLDGASMGYPGPQGQAVNDLSLDPQAIMDRHKPAAAH